MYGLEIIVAIFWIFGIIGAVNKKKGNAGGSLKPAFSTGDLKTALRKNTQTKKGAVNRDFDVRQTARPKKARYTHKVKRGENMRFSHIYDGHEPWDKCIPPEKDPWDKDFYKN
ncbi:MAG: hypothetical protein SPC84_07525 [Oscillospiraceae bacterium]|nr:hypothetical protein [Oscillospiraceae bacterium]